MFRNAMANDAACLNKRVGHIPRKRAGSPQEIGRATTDRVSDAASYVPGHILVVDGGALHGFGECDIHAPFIRSSSQLR